MNLAEIEYADLSAMFKDTVVKYNNTPVYILHINPGLRADILNLGNGEESVKSLLDNEWCFKPINTGYVNIQGYSFYISRIPSRQWKQGLHRENVKIKYNFPYGDVRMNIGYERVRTLICKPLHNMARKIYPSLQQAVEMFEDGNTEIAFDRQFCVSRTGVLYYKTEEVGGVDLDTLEVKFDKRYEFLRKAL